MLKASDVVSRLADRIGAKEERFRVGRAELKLEHGLQRSVRICSELGEVPAPGELKQRQELSGCPRVFWLWRDARKQDHCIAEIIGEERHVAEDLRKMITVFVDGRPKPVSGVVKLQEIV